MYTYQENSCDELGSSHQSTAAPSSPPPLPPACNRMIPHATACNRLQPRATLCYRVQPRATACYCFQPCATMCYRVILHLLHTITSNDMLLLTIGDTII